MIKKRLQILIKGAVQGVGFRPFIFRLAQNLKLNGYVANSSSGVTIEVESPENILKEFIKRIESEKPAHSIIVSFEYSYLDPIGYDSFEIRESKTNGEISALILPDISVCDDCLREMFNPNDRRYLYPFINCTNCGPRFSIIEKIPYDRPNTSMKKFEMCDDCRKEYENPSDRRFHAQPIACSKCGPHLEFWDYEGKIISLHDQALLDAAKKIREGKIIALKGLGGFQLIVDARNDLAAQKLREKKQRDEKPFALMFPNIEMVKSVCNVSENELQMLLSPESPIVLMKKKSKTTDQISKTVAPQNPYLGIMLPYTPLHHLLMKELNFPIVATSGNISEEPICINEFEALERLKNIADFYLIHNRPIVRHVDDSIVKSVNNRRMILRRARGFAPLPIEISSENKFDKDEDVLAVGGHLKNTIAIKKGKNIFVSQHIGDLSTNEAFSTFKKTITDFEEMYRANPQIIVTDMHPEYLSTKYAASTNLELAEVQHHFAHIASCRLENQIEGEALGVSWDGTGFGLDKTIWGGEFFYSNDSDYKHVAQFKKFRLPGGEFAIKEPRRTACGLLYEIYSDDFIDYLPASLKDNFSQNALSIIQKLFTQKINSPQTSSAGRLFDAVSSLLNICCISNYEGQAAMMLEFAIEENEEGEYPFQILEDKIIIIDWKPLIKSILADLNQNIHNSVISARFHNTLAKIVLVIAEKFNLNKVILSGGCFQNSYLTEKTIKTLEENNFQAYWHQRIPPNDGGISVGQIAAHLSSKKSDLKKLEPTIESK